MKVQLPCLVGRTIISLLDEIYHIQQMSSAMNICLPGYVDVVT